MRELVYAMRFTGHARSAGMDGKVLEAAATAPGATITTIIGPAGLSSTLAPLAGEIATFESELTLTGQTSFQEIGSLNFGHGHWFRFSTVGNGYLAPSADPGRKQGAAMWRLDGGEGQFTGATGLITSNFFVDDQLRVVDHHFGVVLVP